MFVSEAASKVIPKVELPSIGLDWWVVAEKIKEVAPPYIKPAIEGYKYARGAVSVLTDINKFKKHFDKALKTEETDLAFHYEAFQMAIALAGIVVVFAELPALLVLKVGGDLFVDEVAVAQDLWKGEYRLAGRDLLISGKNALRLGVLLTGSVELVVALSIYKIACNSTKIYIIISNIIDFIYSLCLCNFML